MSNEPRQSNSVVNKYGGPPHPYARPSNDEEYILSNISGYASDSLIKQVFASFEDATSQLVLATHLYYNNLNEPKLSYIQREMGIPPDDETRNYSLAKLLHGSSFWNDKFLRKAADVIGQLGKIRAVYPSDDINFAKEAVGRLGVPGATRQSTARDIMSAIWGELGIGDHVNPEYSKMATMNLILGYALRDHMANPTHSGGD